jgi:hypothetical protein
LTYRKCVHSFSGTLTTGVGHRTARLQQQQRAQLITLVVVERADVELVLVLQAAAVLDAIGRHHARELGEIHQCLSLLTDLELDATHGLGAVAAAFAVLIDHKPLSDAICSRVYVPKSTDTVPSSRIEQIPDDGIPRRTQKKKSLELVGVSEPEEWIKIAAVLGKRLPGENPEAVKLMLQGILAYTRCAGRNNALDARLAGA